MPRHRRVSPTGYVQHVLNRGDHRETLFHKPADFCAFLGVVAETASRIPMRILAYCVMRNHFHLVLWPHDGADLPRFMHLLMSIHIGRYLRHYPPISPGHLYQARYTNSLVETGRSVVAVARYVEANALTAGIVRRAEEYPWSSASPHASDPERPDISEWPVRRPTNWSEWLNSRTPAEERRRIQRSASRGAPFGGPDWTRRVVAAFDLEHTLRRRGRPTTASSLLAGNDSSSL